MKTYWRTKMNKEEIIGNWNVVKGKVKEQWSELTDDELLNIDTYQGLGNYEYQRLDKAIYSGKIIKF